MALSTFLSLMVSASSSHNLACLNEASIMIDRSRPTKSAAVSRPQVGKAVHLTGMALAAYMLVYAVWLAILWRDTYGALALMSGFCHATVAYLVGRSLRRILDPSYRRLDPRHLDQVTHTQP
jgi:hypothetical protein